MASHSPDDTEDFPGRLLHQAALWDNAELLEDLLNGEQLEHLDCRDAWGRTPLHAAATTEGSRCLRILLQTGSDPNVSSGPRAEHRTCLHIAAEHGALENIRLILDHGADLLAKDVNGLTALDLAEQGEHTSCMQVLKNAAEASGIVADAGSDGNSDELRRTCRHMGMTHSSPICDICKLIKAKYSAITPAERTLYSDIEVAYREEMDDNGLVKIFVPVEHRKTIENYVNAMTALDYVQRNHADILLFSVDDTNEMGGRKRKLLKK